jgi:hypothetical protein
MLDYKNYPGNNEGSLIRTYGYYCEGLAMAPTTIRKIWTSDEAYQELLEVEKEGLKLGAIGGAFTGFSLALVLGLGLIRQENIEFDNRTIGLAIFGGMNLVNYGYEIVRSIKNIFKRNKLEGKVE